MSVFIATAIVGVTVLAALCSSASQKTRLRQIQNRDADPQRLPDTTAARPPGKHQARPSTSSTAADKARTAAYREILDALRENLDEEIAEWSAVLQEFPQVIGASELDADDGRIAEPIVETEDVPSAYPAPVTQEAVAPLSRTRQLSPEERSLILRLLHSDFAPEEVALWLNLPLERVQEIQIRGGLT
jgi:hypothetical protein